MTNFTLVKNFHLVFQQPIRNEPTLLSTEERMLRVGLIDEEADELHRALTTENLVGSADALGDLLYVTYGTAVQMGIPIDEVFAEIHRSNMTKLDENGKPIFREDGKVLKGPNFQPPDLKGILGL